MTSLTPDAPERTPESGLLAEIAADADYFEQQERSWGDSTATIAFHDLETLRRDGPDAVSPETRERFKVMVETRRRFERTARLLRSIAVNGRSASLGAPAPPTPERIWSLIDERMKLAIGTVKKPEGEDRDHDSWYTERMRVNREEIDALFTAPAPAEATDGEREERKVIEPHGLRYRDAESGADRLLIADAKDDFRGWICYRSGDGQWTTLRKAEYWEAAQISIAAGLPVIDDAFKTHVVKVIGDAMSDLRIFRDSAKGSMCEQFVAEVKDRLRSSVSPAAVTPEMIAEARKNHRAVQFPTGRQICPMEGEDWPCAVVRLCAALTAPRPSSGGTP